MAPLDGGNFQGINPPMLQQLIKSLNSGVTGAQPLANSYVSQFTRVGLDTGPIQKLLADYGWASAQQPMLNRRYSLASHQPSGDFTGGKGHNYFAMAGRGPDASWRQCPPHPPRPKLRQYKDDGVQFNSKFGARIRAGGISIFAGGIFPFVNSEFSTEISRPRFCIDVIYPQP